MAIRPVSKGSRPVIGGSPAIPLDIKRDLQTLASLSYLAQDTANAAQAKAGSIQVPTFDQIRKALQASGESPLNIAGLTGGARTTALVGTHAQRLSTAANAQPIGTFFYETDRTYLYLVASVSGSNAWKYASGVYAANLASLPGGLGTNDAGALFNANDYAHVLRWTGSGWTWGPGDAGSGMTVEFEVDPSPTTGWHLYDGSTVTYLKSDGSTGSVTLPDLTSASNKAAYIKAGSPNSGVNAAVAPTGSLSGGSIGSATTGVTNPANTGSTAVSLSNDTGLSFTCVDGVDHPGAVHPHTHIDSGHTHAIGAPTDPGHTHSLAGGSIAMNADGQPQNIVRRPWLRL